MCVRGGKRRVAYRRIGTTLVTPFRIRSSSRAARTLATSKAPAATASTIALSSSVSVASMGQEWAAGGSTGAISRPLGSPEGLFSRCPVICRGSSPFLKTAVAATLPGVRIPSPPLESLGILTAPPDEGLRGPDLVRPRPDLRIVPGRLSGSPHVVHTRLETRAIYALNLDGLDSVAIRTLYPYVTEAQVAQALDLERQLEDNLAIRIAA